MFVAVLLWMIGGTSEFLLFLLIPSDCLTTLIRVTMLISATGAFCEVRVSLLVPAGFHHLLLLP